MVKSDLIEVSERMVEIHLDVEIEMNGRDLSRRRIEMNG